MVQQSVSCVSKLLLFGDNEETAVSLCVNSPRILQHLFDPCSLPYSLSPGRMLSPIHASDCITSQIKQDSV